MNQPIADINLPQPAQRDFYPPGRGYNHAVKTYQALSQWAAKLKTTYNSAGQGVGPMIASASTITVTAEIHHVTGTAAIQQINLGSQQFSGPIVLIADGLWSLVTGGNIAAASMPDLGTHVQIVLDNLIMPQMWYPIAGIGSRNFVIDEVPAGTIDGINRTFTLAHTPAAGTVAVYRNGIRQSVAAGDYTIAGMVITFAAAPDSGDVLLVDYRI